MGIIDANRRTNTEHDFYQTLPCQIKCLCDYLNLNEQRVLDAGSGNCVIADQLKQSFPEIRLETSEINTEQPDNDISEFNFFPDRFFIDRGYKIKPGIINTSQFPKSDHDDFLKLNRRYNFIISNPPYSLKNEFIEHALELAVSTFMLLPLQVLNYIEFCEKWLDNPKYCGKILMYPKVILNPQGEYIQGGNTGYAWFHWENESIEYNSKYEVIEDIRKYK